MILSSLELLTSWIAKIHLTLHHSCLNEIWILDCNFGRDNNESIEELFEELFEDLLK